MKSSISVKCLPALSVGGLVCMALLLLGNAGNAPTTSPVGVVDITRVITGSSKVQKSIERASKTAKSLRDEMAAKQQRYLALEQELQSQKSVLSAGETKKRQDEIKQLQQVLKLLSKRLMEEMGKAQNNALPPLEQQIKKVIGDVAATRRISVVLSADSAVFYLPQSDLTAEVIRRVDSGK